jgi:hypothetical protein
MCAASHGAQVRGETLPGWLEWLPKKLFDKIARHSMDFWLSSENLPRPENRIQYDGKRVVLALEENNMDAHHRLRRKLEKMLNATGAHPKLVERSLCLADASFSPSIGAVNPTLTIIANALRVADHMRPPPS